MASDRNSLLSNRLLYIFLLLLSFFFAGFYTGRLPYAILQALLLLPLFSFLHVLIILLRFKYSQSVESVTVTKGDTVDFVFSVYNEDFFMYPYMNITFYGSNSIFSDQFKVKGFSLSPFSGINNSFSLKCNYRGYYEIGIKSIDIIDYLGIFRLRYTISEPRYITVIPKVIPLSYFRLVTGLQSEAHTALDSKHEDMSTISGFRKYAYGDGLKRIHWKLSAKTGNLIVKNFQSTSETSVVLMLDLYPNPYMIGYDAEALVMLEDKIIEALAALLAYCLSNWLPVKLIYSSEKIVSLEASNLLELDGILKILSTIRFNSDIELSELLKLYSQNVPEGNNLIVFTSCLEPGLYNELFKAGRKGYGTSLIYVAPDKLTGLPNPYEKSIMPALPEIGVNGYRLGLDDVEPDILGRAYEYLLRKFAEGQGQSAGEFYTPTEVGFIIAMILDPEPGMEPGRERGRPLQARVQDLLVRQGRRDRTGGD
ncbi:MAG: DUF58 domain-containing protein [Clostridiales bacterium]|nr:DUF58 domain-containing protein [Clostridiales bacterium]